MNPIAVITEQADQLSDLFAELTARALPFVVVDPRTHSFDPTDHTQPYSLVVNLVSPTSGRSIEYTSLLLMHYERIDIRVLNGLVGFGFLNSLAKQIILIDQSGLRTPQRKVLSLSDGQSSSIVRIEDVPPESLIQRKQVKLIGAQAINPDQHPSTVVQNAELLLRHASLDFAIVEYVIDPRTSMVQYLGLAEYRLNSADVSKLLVDRIQYLVAPAKPQQPYDALSHMADWDAAI